MSLNRPTRISGVAASRLNPLAGPPRNRRGSGNASLVSAAKLKLRELSLELPSPFSTDALCALISKRRVRPIMIHEVDHLPFDGPCGLWVEFDDADHILVSRGASESHQAHIVVHELAHVLYDHQGLLGTDYLHLSLPSLNPDVVRRVLGRGSYGPQEEQEAEVL